MSETPMPSNSVTLTVDGQVVTVPKGATLLQAAEALGTRVPHYCYHPGLSAPAQCRLCLVQVEGAPKLLPSCVTQAQEGQVVHTQSQIARDGRTGVLEFYLTNHPLDCPICDQSGECEFQDYVHAEGPKAGRLKEPKRVFGRDDFGGDVLFYGDRCVMCTRCVRFMNEVARDPRLTVVERGNRSVIDTFFEEGLSGSPFHGNVVDICPVGALVSKDFLHKARAWDLDRTPSICPNCSQGCNIDLNVRDNQVQRFKPRTNLEVNEHWMCDYGRHRYHDLNRTDRLASPRVREENGEWVSLDWEAALGEVSQRLNRLQERGMGSVTAVASPFSSNEDLGALRALVHALGGGRIVYRSPRAENEIPLPGFPNLTRRRDLAPNVRGAEILGFERVGNDQGQGGLDLLAVRGGLLLVLGDELRDQSADFGLDAALSIYLGSALPSGGGHLQLPVTTFAEQEGTFTNQEGRVQRFWPGLQAPGVARPAWWVLSALLARVSGGSEIERPDLAFRTLAEDVPAYQGLSYELLGSRGALVNEPLLLQGA